MPYCKTQGIVLRKVDFSETSLILTFLTRDYGKVSTLAKGAKRSGKKAVGSLDMLCLADIVFLQKSSGLHTLTEYEVTDYFAGLYGGLKRLYAADYAIELVRDSVEQEACPDVFELLAATLGRLVTASDLAPFVFAYELKLLSALGYQPELDTCTSCGRALTANVFFHAAVGGAVCRRCHSDDCLPLSPGALATMRTLVRSDLDHIGRLRIAPAAHAEIRQAIRRHIEHALSRRPRMWRYLAV